MSVRPQPQQCRELAAECSRKAVETADPVLRRTYWDLAEHWNRIAAQADELERRGSV
jgi:hypothetical protein